MDTLTFDIHHAATKTSTPRLLMNAAGGEYTQSVVDGIHSNLQRWQIQYTKRAGADIKAVSDFFVQHRGYKAFFWTPGGEASPRKFICPEHTRVLDHYDVVQSITATLEEVP